jgi:2-oxoglutarate ferredoxin oxidoreductase subunit delta
MEVHMALASIEPELPLTGGPPDAAGAPFRSFSPLDIAIDRCKGCELCVAACPKGVLELDRDAVNRLGHHPIRLTDAAHCTSCAFCARVCPDAVFTVYARPKEA